jgi:hypothetical protein
VQDPRRLPIAALLSNHEAWGLHARAEYVRWLDREATAHARRDRKRWKKRISIADCREAIHAAVLRFSGRDFYTCEGLDRSLISRYDNAQSQSGGIR